MSAAERAPSDAVVRHGYLKKLKTMKKKYFVLRADTPENSARLEYYDTEKKWRAHGQPKKIIPLKSCFNIMRRLDTRQKHVIGLYMREECLCLVPDSEEELADWLSALMELLHPGGSQDNVPHPRQNIWQVNVQKKGLGASRNIVGLYNLFLTDNTLSLVKIRVHPRYVNPLEVRPSDAIQYSLDSIRRCGDSECFFYMEVGRSSVTGAGELWMHTEDPNIAKSMHATILHAMSNVAKMKEDLGPSRVRSSSATEASKPISVRRQTHTGTKTHGLSPSRERTFCSGRSCVGLCISPSENASAAYCAPLQPAAPAEGESETPVGSVQSAVGALRERCDSLPSNRRLGAPAGHRPHSMYTRGLSHSPPAAVANSPLSPHSGAYSTDSAGSSISIDEPDSFHHHPPLLEDPPHSIISRLMNSRTPDERSIPEEAIDETLCLWQPERPEGEVTSPVPIQTSPKPMSPANSEPSRVIHSRAGCNSSNHSRTSSLVEEILEDSMTPRPDGGYVDMEPSREGAQALSPAASVSSVTSGTPSTDLRFSEFHLEKVSSYFPGPVEDDNRPLRAYSVGSRPEYIKKVINRPESQTASDSARKRAFSVGSHSKTYKDNRILNHGTPPHRHLQHLVNAAHAGTKSSSAPVLVPGTPSRHAYNSNHSSTEPLNDLMEMDFTNRSPSSPAKGEMPPPAPPALPAHRSSQLTLSVPQPILTEVKKDTDGYMDMSPGKVSAGYVEMKPAENLSAGVPIVKTIASTVRKVSITKSPPSWIYDINEGMDNQQVVPQSTPEGYVEMSWNNAKAGNAKLRNRISSLPIAISSNNPHDPKMQPFLSSSPVLNLLKESSNPDANVHKGTPPKVSPGVSPVTPVTPSPLSSMKRSKKHHARRNSKELVTPVGNCPQTIFPFSPGSPMKPFTKAPLAVSEIMPGRKCPVDASSGTLKLSLSNALSPESECTSLERAVTSNIETICVSDYMEMIPGRLSTVKEINESSGINTKSSVDKDIKQLINKATKVSGSVLDSDFDYIILKPNASVTNKSINELVQQKSVDESSAHNQVDYLDSTSDNLFSDLPFAKPPNGSQTITGTKTQNVPRKISTPAFSNSCRESFLKENQMILSSNPLATKTLMVNPLMKSNVNITNINQVQTVKKPILVVSQTQSITANFKPIAAGEACEPRGPKAGSPKPVESVLNRQLAASHKASDGYETLTAQNGQLQKLGLSRPSPVNNKCKKGNGSGSRPPSVNSEGPVRSRPSSVSSELGGTTPGGSRPSSVTGEAGACRLHYASLELEAPERSPLPSLAPASTFTYAQIDFAKSEELKNSKNLVAKSKN